MKKRILSMLLALVMLATLLPLGLIDTAEAVENWLWPAKDCYIISSNYGARDLYGTGKYDNYHRGIDIIGADGTIGKPIRAAKSGTIYSRNASVADNTYIAGSMGNYVAINHGDGTCSVYMHMRPNGVASIGAVRQGDIIGYIGNTGDSYGAHLHFQIYTNQDNMSGSTLNPMPTNGNITIQNPYVLPSGWESRKTTYVFEVQPSAHTCDKGSYQYYEAAHPHYKCYKCSICGKIWRDESEPTRVDSCELCYPRTATITYYDADGYVWTTDSSLANESYTLASGYPTRSGSYFVGWSYTPGTSGFDLRPDDTVTIKGNTDLYPVYVTHEQAVSGEPVCIYNISDFDSTGYDVSSIQYDVNTRVDDSAWGAWSDYTFSDVSASDTTQVETDTLYRYYHYLCPSCGAHEPFYGKSDCGAQIPSDAWHEFWSTVPYASCKPQSFSYTSAKYYTTSLGDGEIWCFSAGNLHDTAPGTVDTGGSAPVIKTGYMTRDWETKYETVVRNVTAYQITKAAVDYGSCGENLTWGLDDYGVLTISGTGNMTDFGDYSQAAPWYRHRSLIETVVIQHGVTSIGDCAFNGCKSLTGVTIPNSVTGIGNRAFNGCSSMASVTIPSSVTSIGDYAFNSCSSLTGVTIPNSVTSIGYGAFCYCKSLTRITIPNSVTSIENYTFQSCESLTSVTIPNSVTSIGNRAFSYCTSLTSVTIPKSVTQIEFGAFIGSNAAITVASGNSKYCSVAGALYNKQKTTLFYPGMIKEGNFRIPNSVTTIANSAFKGCSALTGVTIPNSVTSIGDEAFMWCSALTSLTIPNSVTSIGGRVFEGCTSVTSVTIPNSVASIGESAFAHCAKLTSVTIPKSVTSIGESAFNGCTSLTSVTIPNSVTSIEICAFDGCSLLTDVYYGGTETDWAKITIANGNQDLLNATLHAKPVSRPANVTLVSAKAVSGGIQVTWKEAAGAVTYKVYRKDATNTKWTALTTTATGTSYVDKTAKAGVKYTYTVRGVASDGKTLSPSYNKTGVSATMPKPVSRPANVTLTGAKVVTGGIQVTWQKANGATKYRVYRKDATNTGWKALTSSATGTSFLDKTAVTGVKYTYTVRGIAADGKTLSSSYDKIGVSAVIKPAKVVLISAKADSAGILVTWQKATGAHSYQVYRKTAGTGWKCIAKNIHDTEWKDIDAAKGTKYIYTVRAVADDGTTRGGYDKTGKPATVTKDPTTPAIVTLGKAVAGKNGITVTWSYAADARTYRVYRKAAGETKWTIVAKNAEGKNWTDKNVTKGVKYTYTVRGVNANGKLSPGYNKTGVSTVAK